MEIEVYSAFPCLIECNGEKESLGVNEHITLFERNFSVYPLSEGYSFDVDIDKTSSFYKVAQKNGKTLVFLLGGLFAENITCRKFSYNGIKSSVELGKRQVVFAGENDKKIIHLNCEIKDASIGNFMLIDYCLKNNNCIICYNPAKNDALVFNGDEVRLEENGFMLKKSGFNYKEIEEHYIVDNAGLKVKNKNYILSDFSSSANETIAYKFMCNIKEGDFDNCIKLLSPSLAEKLDVEKLKSYFGHISYFYMLDSLSTFAISDDKNIIYEFTLSGNKISDITDNL